MKTLKEFLNEARLGAGTSISFNDFLSTAGKEDIKGANITLKALGIKAADAIVLMEWDEPMPWMQVVKALKAKNIKFKMASLKDGNIAILAKQDLNEDRVVEFTNEGLNSVYDKKVGDKVTYMRNKRKRTAKIIAVGSKNGETRYEIDNGGFIYQSDLNEDRVADVKAEYLLLKKMTIKALRNQVAQLHRIVNVKEYDKEGAISDILRSNYGDKAVDKAFNI